MIVESSEIHEINTRAVIEWHELRDLIIAAVKTRVELQEGGRFNPDMADLKIEQLTEGSPSYAINKWRVVCKFSQGLAE